MLSSFYFLCQNRFVWVFMSRDDLFIAFFRMTKPNEGGREASSPTTVDTTTASIPTVVVHHHHHGHGEKSLVAPHRLDLLSLLACFRQGIEPSDLLFQPHVEDAENRDERRRAKIRLLEQERQSISSEVLQRDGSKSRLSLGHELHSLMRKLNPGHHPQHPLLGLTISVQEERLAAMELVRQLTEMEDRKMMALSRSRGVLAQTHGENFGQGEEEIVKLRNRQMRSVSKELQKEVEAQQLNARMQEDDARRHEQAEIHKRQLLDTAAMRQDERMKRLAIVREKTEEKYQSAKERAEEYDRRAAERESRRQELLAERAAAQREKTEQRLAMVKQRAMIVQQDTEVRAELLSHEMVQKQSLHEERKVNLVLRRDTQRELGRIRDLHHNIALREWSEKQQVMDEVVQVELYKRYAAQDERVEMLLDATRHHAGDLHKEVDEKRAIALKRRDLAVLDKLTRRQQRLQRSVKREESLLTIQDTTDVYRKSYYERSTQRQRNNEDNRARLERLAEYKIGLQEAKVKQCQDRVEQVEAAKARRAVDRQVERQRLADQKHGLMQAIMQLRSQRNLACGDTDAEVFMRQKIEAMEAAQRRTPRVAVPRNVFSQISWNKEGGGKEGGPSSPAPPPAPPSTMEPQATPTPGTATAV